MNKLNDFLERTLVPISMKLNNQRHVASIRDAFILSFPLTISAAFVVLINNILFSPDSFIVQLLRLNQVFPNIADAQQVLSSISNGTVSMLAVFIAYLVAQNLAKHFNADQTLTGLASLACFMILQPPMYMDATISAVVMPTRFFGSQGLFIAMIVGSLVGEFLPKLLKNKRLVVKMPDSVPPMVSRSFSGMIPVVITLGFFGILNFLVLQISPNGVGQLIYDLIQMPLSQFGANLGGVLLFSFFQTLLFSIGIHGPATLSPLRLAVFTENVNTNLEFINGGGRVWDVPHPDTWQGLNDIFANMGGTGATLGLLIAIFIASRRADYREVAKLSIIPGIFNINEPVIFGLPIVLNPILMIPFILVPLVNNIIAYIAIVIAQIIPPTVISVPWPTPVVLSSFLASGGNILAAVVGAVCLGVSVLIYLPFVLASNKASAAVEAE